MNRDAPTKGWARAIQTRHRAGDRAGRAAEEIKDLPRCAHRKFVMAVGADPCSAFHNLGSRWAGFCRRNRGLRSCQGGANFAQIKAAVSARRRYSPVFDKLFHLILG